jgi:MFS family permease
MVLPAARNERNVLILTGVGYLSTRCFELMFPTLAVTLAAQYAMRPGDVLSWSFPGYLLFGLGALPAGLLADRGGARLLLIVALFGVGVASLAASETETPRALSFCLAVMGLCASIYHPASVSLIARTIDRRDRARRINGIVGGLGIAATPLVTAAVCARVGWQDTFRGAGYAMCALAVGCAFLRIDEAVRPARAEAPVAPLGRSDTAPLALLLVAAALSGICYRGITLIQPSYLAARVPELSDGLAASLAYACGVVGQYVAGRLADRHDPRRLYVAAHALSLPALLAMALLSGRPLLGAAALYLFFALGMQPLEDSLFAPYIRERWQATASGIRFACTFGVGSLAVWLVCWADRSGGLSYAVLSLAGVVLLAIATAAAALKLFEPSGGPVPEGQRTVAAPRYAAGGGHAGPTASFPPTPSSARQGAYRGAPTERRPPG